MTWLEISGTVGRVAACLGFFIAGMVIFYLLTKVIYRIPEKQQLERLHEPGKFRNAGIIIFGGLAAVLFTGFFGMGLQGIIYFLFLAVLTVVTFIDMDTMEIPFILNIIIFVMGVVSLILQFVSDAAPGSEFLAMDGVTIVSRLIGMICISLPLYLIVLIIPEGFGGGADVCCRLLTWLESNSSWFLYRTDPWRNLWRDLSGSQKPWQKRPFCIWPFLKRRSGYYIILWK